MDSANNLTFMMVFLKDFNYPLIHSMTSEEISNVFHISNRCFLVCWTLKLLDENCYPEILDGREYDKELLGNLVYQHGFCTTKQKNGFFNGDLPLPEQVQILHKMFRCIERLKKAELIETTTPVSLENLQSLINLNLNIFPTFGEIRTCSEKEECEEEVLEISKLENGIEHLQICISNLSSEKNLRNYCQMNETEIRRSVETLDANFSQFDRIVKALSKEKRSEANSSYEVSPKSEELLLRCNKYLKVVSQYIEDLKTINNFTIVDSLELQDEISPLIEFLVEQIDTSRAL